MRADKQSNRWCGFQKFVAWDNNGAFNSRTPQSQIPLCAIAGKTLSTNDKQVSKRFIFAL